jgi:predicted ATP-grasp superfamily ATP-dependent carboligase
MHARRGQPMRRIRRPRRRARRGVGAVVAGGDFNGLGVVQSIGRLGAPVCVVDDERCISHYSRYVSDALLVRDLRSDGALAAQTILEIGARLGLEGWVLYPTRDEIVGAVSRHRALLAERFRVSTDDWSSVRRRGTCVT